MNTQENKEPTEALQKAIQKLSVFTQLEASRLEFDEKGNLVAPKLSSLEKIIGLARYYVSPLFSDQAKSKQNKKLHQIKQEILEARDTLKSHSFLIEKLKEGNEYQKKLAQSALETISHYNAIVQESHDPLTSKYNFYNYERNHLLLDKEIKGQVIELPQNYSVRFDSHSKLPGQETITELSATLQLEPKTKGIPFSSTYKKTDQFMIDTFKMKGIRMLQTHQVQARSIGDIISLVKQTPIEIHDEGTDLISMAQRLDFIPGYTILLSGSFKRNGPDSKFMSMPVIESFRLTSEMVHSGFPYPSQHSGWALSEKMIDAHPLRTDQVPLFHALVQRKKKLAHSLLFDQTSLARSRQNHKLTREVFDRKRSDFLALQWNLIHALTLGADIDHVAAIKILDEFFDFIATTISAFDALTKTHRQINDYFIKQPAVALEESWLSAGATSLRAGSYQEKVQSATKILQGKQKENLKHFETEGPVNDYVKFMGSFLGRAAQSITLQYQSEKIGFAPPMLSDFERKLQTCAFQQIEWFIKDCEPATLFSEDRIEMDLKTKVKADLLIFRAASVEDLDLSAAHLTNSLEIYFNSRFYALEPRRWST